MLCLSFYFSSLFGIKTLSVCLSVMYIKQFLPLCCPQNLNFTGFRKILKKHDKILDTSRGADWRVVHVEVAPFYTCKKITQLITETEVHAHMYTYTRYSTPTLM